MALVLGTNCGFVTTAPTSDPQESTFIIDNNSFAIKDTTNASAEKITEIGWWCDSATGDTNFEVGIYAHDGGDNEPGNRLFVDDINAKGTTAGWKRVTVDWEISGSTIYWIAFQSDSNGGPTRTNYSVGVTGARFDYKSGETSLPNPWGDSSLSFGDDSGVAIYAIWEAAVTTETKLSGSITQRSREERREPIKIIPLTKFQMERREEDEIFAALKLEEHNRGIS